MSKITATALLAAVAATSMGCTFIARSPEQYRDDTRAVLESAAAGLKTCYDGVIKGNKSATGTVTVRFTVEQETGIIKDAQVDAEQSTAPAPVQDCVMQSLGGLKLDPPDARDGKATFTYEFEIAPQQAPAKAAAPPKA